MDLARAAQFVPPPSNKREAAKSALLELVEQIELIPDNVVEMASAFADVIKAHREKRKQKEGYEEAMPIIAKIALNKAPEEKRDSLLPTIAEFAGKRVVYGIGSWMVRTVVGGIVRGAARLLYSAASWLVRGIIQFVVRPIITGIAGFVVTNPILALAVGAVGAAGYMVWDTFFSKTGKAARQSEADNMIQSAEQVNITPEGAAGVPTREMKADARGSYATRAAQVAGPKPAPTTGYTPAKPVEVVQAKDWQLGQTSKRYESGRGGPGTVSTGAGDAGGISYGTYQFASTRGVPQAYLAQSKYGPEFAGMKVNSEEFIAKWKEIAKREGAAFEKDQHDYVQKVYFDVQHNKLKKNGVDLTARGPAVQDMIWSTAVQYGPTTGRILEALTGKNANALSDSEIVSAVQDFRAANAETHFKSSSKAVQDSIMKRAADEKARLLALDTAYQKEKAASTPSTTTPSTEVAVKDKDAAVTAPTAQRQAANDPTQNGAQVIPIAQKEKQYVRDKSGKLIGVG